MISIALKLGLFASVSFCALVRPSINQSLNYIHVAFEWDQEPDAFSYQIQIDTLLAFQNPIINNFTQTTSFLDDQNLSWDERYYWRVRPVFSNNAFGEWIGPSVFFTKESVIENLDIEINDSTFIQSGLTAFGGWSPEWRSAMVDQNGKEIWNDDGFMIKLSLIDSLGKMYGFSLTSWPTYTGVKINVDIDPIWHPEDTHVDDHEFIELRNGNYMGFTYDDRLGPIPSNNYMTQAFRDLGYAADDSTLEFMWRGHVITEWNSGGEVNWTWNAWDHFTTDDFDNNGFTWWAAYTWSGQFYDWMHSNSIFFDENSQHIYISTRHLSRISKIAYPSGNVIWNMGLPEPYISTGDESICNDLLFSFQHHAQILENGNLIFFDNGNISDQLFGMQNKISRVLEINVIDDSYCEVVWEYILPPNLFGSAGGGIYVLENGNRLIYTLGDGEGTNEPKIIELSPEDNVIWELSLPGHALHRPFRIPSLHPDRFSVIFDNYTSLSENGLDRKLIHINDNMTLSFNIFNESDYSQHFVVDMNDENGWIGESLDTIYIQKNDHILLEYDVIANNVESTFLNMIVYPLHHDYRKREYNFEISLQGELYAHNNIFRVFNLSDPFPNPFNSNVVLNYNLSKKSMVKITIYDLIGVAVKNLVNEVQNEGNKFIRWNATNNQGQPVSAGVYLYSIEAGEFRQTKKMILLK